VISDLHWLIHQGHVIEFANGTLETAKKPVPKPPKPAAKPAAEPAEPKATAAETTVEQGSASGAVPESVTPELSSSVDGSVPSAGSRQENSLEGAPSGVSVVPLEPPSAIQTPPEPLPEHSVPLQSGSPSECPPAAGREPSKEQMPAAPVESQP
jgi:hypothetical protein